MSVSERIEGVCFIREWPQGRGMLTYWCPGCKGGHTIYFGGGETWQWNGDAVRPTLSPSVLARPHAVSFDESGGNRTYQPRCHSFVRDGRIEYLADSDHELAGQTVDMVPLPERYARFVHPADTDEGNEK